MSNIKLFEDKKVRSLWNEGEEEWYFSVVDVIEVLTDSSVPKDYWYRMKKREKLSGFELSTICRQLKIEATDGKKYATDCSSTEGLLRIIQSIPSPKAEPFKLWLAKVGSERLMETYLKKGYSKEWVNQRLKSIEVRKDLTNEWENRGVKKEQEYVAFRWL
jgi:hypothetical protein